ncbi:Uncharacterized protein APZ42_007528, partial [Daphnia magna]
NFDAFFPPNFSGTRFWSGCSSFPSSSLPLVPPPCLPLIFPPLFFCSVLKIN